MNYFNLTDEELVWLAQKNGEGIEVLMDRYKNKVNSFARSYFLTGGDVDDLIQEGMVGFFKAITTYNGKASFNTHAYTCIKTSILSAVKKSNRLKNIPLNNYVSLSGGVDESADKTEIIIDGSFGPEEIFINAENLNELKNIIAKNLSKFENNVLSLYLKGYSYGDIAQKTKKQVKSIDNALQRIRKKLAKAVEEN